MSVNYPVLRMDQTRRSPIIIAGVIAGLYLLAALAWIWFTDGAVAWLFADPATAARVQSFKGSLFVLLSAGVIYFLVSRTIVQIRRAQQQLDLALRSGGIGLWDLDLATNQISLSDTWFAQLGYKPHEFPKHLNIAEMGHPEDREPSERRFKEYLASAGARGKGGGYEQLVRFKHKDGSYRWILSRGELIHDSSGKPVRIAGCHIDMTPRVLAQRWLDEQNRVLQRLAEGDDLHGLLDDICTTIEQQFPGARASVMFSEQARDGEGGGSDTIMRSAAGPSLPKAYLELVDKLPIGPEVGACGSAMALGEPVVCEDLATDPKWAALWDRMSGFGLRSCWSQPIRGSAGKVLGSFALYRDRPSTPRAEERERIAAAAHLVGVAIQRHRADEELRQAEGLYRSLVQLMPDGMIVHRGGEIIFANTAATVAMSGQVLQPLIGRRISDVLSGEELPSVQERVERMLNEGVPQPRRELRVRREDGSLLYVETVATRVDFEGRPAVMAVLRDITERKAAEDALKRLVEGTTTAGAAFFDSLVHALTEALGVRIATVGELAGERFDRVRIVAQHADGAITHGGEYPLADTPCEGVLAGQACHIVDGVTDRFPKDRMLADLHAVAYIGVPLNDAEGNVIGILNVVHDATIDQTRRPMEVMSVFAARAAAELDRVRVETELDETASRYRLLFDANPEAMWVYDTQTLRFTDVNDAALSRYGYSREEFLRLRATDLHPEKDRPRARDPLSVRQVRPSDLGVWEHRLADGSSIMAEIVADSIELDGSPATLVLAKDVTARVNADRRQQLLMAELDHRVKNNLATVVSLAEQTARSKSDQAAFLESFLGRLRALARLHQALASAKWQGAQLRSLVEQTLGTYAPDSQGRIHIDGQDLTLPARAAQPIAMALNELATNAAKYGALSSPSGEVRVTWEQTPPPASTPDRPPSLRLVWAEHGGPAVRPPTRHGLGTELIERAIPYELRGTAKLRYDESGIVFEMNIPLIRDVDNVVEGQSRVLPRMNPCAVR